LISSESAGNVDAVERLRRQVNIERIKAPIREEP
jgi:hypothetical protein